jgi:hypothetical protein
MLDSNDKREHRVKEKRREALRSAHGFQTTRRHAKYDAAVLARVELDGKVRTVFESLRVP